MAMTKIGNPNPEIALGELDPAPEIDGQLLNDMFYTMAYNLENFRRGPQYGPSMNREMVDRLCDVMPRQGPTFRDWRLHLKVRSIVRGSLIMRHGARLYLEEIEDGVPTVSGIVSSINCDVASLCIDPVTDGSKDKDREVAVIPYDLRSLVQKASIEVVSIG